MKTPKPIRRERHRTCADVRRNMRNWVNRGKGNSQRWTKLARFQKIIGGQFGKDGEVIRFGDGIFRLAEDGSVWVTAMPRLQEPAKDSEPR